MIISSDKLLKIDLCYENCKVDVIKQTDLVGVYIERRLKYSRVDCRTPICPQYRLKTFEIALKKMDYEFTCDLAQIILHFVNGTQEHFFIVWGKDDTPWDYSSLQTFHKKDSYISLTSNCQSQF